MVMCSRTHDGTALNLETAISGGLLAGWTALISAEAFNETGRIAGWGHKKGYQRAFLPTPY